MPVAPRLVVMDEHGGYCINGLAPPYCPSELETASGPMALRRVRPTYVLYAPKPRDPEAA